MMRRRKHRGIGGLTIIGMALSAGLWSAPSSSAAQDNCGEFYRIKRGDTLRDITVRSLGHDRYQVLFQANQEILPNPQRIETGQLIFVPCAQGAVQNRKTALAQAGLTPTARDNLGDRAAAANSTQIDVTIVTPYAPKFPGKSRVAPKVPVKQPNSKEAQAPQSGRSLQILTASGIRPIADFQLPSGGLMSVLIQEALLAGGNQDTPEISFVEDRRAHLSVLMPTGAFDLTFPWPGVDCKAGGLGPEGTALCRDFVVSRPVYETTIATVVPSDSPLVSATSPDALRGVQLCRPAGFPPVDLESMGLDIRVLIKRTEADCIAAITSGQVQGMSTPKGQRKSPNWPGMVFAPGLSWSIPVYALAWRNSPGAQQTIADLNNGLERLQRSGRWFKVVSKYLHDVNETIGDVKGN